MSVPALPTPPSPPADPKNSFNVWLPATYEQIAVKYPPWWKLYLGAVGMLATLLTVFGVLVWIWPFSRNSALSLILDLISPGSDHGGNAGVPGWLYWPILAFIIVPILRPSILWDHARREEVAYRRGAEDWSLPKRFYKAVRFGLAHFWNIIIPLGLALAITTGGLYLTWVYRRAYKRSVRTTRLAFPDLHRDYAIECSTRAHVAWNRFALVFMGVVVTAYAVTSLT